jgi:xanthine dehydrogenase accessory factor
MTTVRADLLLLASELTRRRESFVSATVVRREAPSSAQVGDAALITRDGIVHGWLGGSCTHHTVVSEALRTLADGKPKLIAITADGAPRADGIAVFPMTCHSGGSVEIFVEPVLPAPRLTVFGASAVARALVRIGAACGYEIEQRADDRERTGGDSPPPGDRHFVVVATMGQFDEDALADAITLSPSYLGLVASRKRFAQLREILLDRGTPAAALDHISCPAGLDIGAHTPEEIAVSILAEIVHQGTKQAAPVHAVTEIPVDSPIDPPAAGMRPVEVIDPVCGMTVIVTSTTPTHELDGQVYHFCCGGCRGRFAKHPERYLTASVG